MTVHKNNIKKPVQPSAIELEQAVLGALMLDKNVMADVVSTLKVGHLYLEKHQIVFQAMLHLFEKSFPIDLLTVGEEIKKMGMLRQIGPDYLVELTNRVASAANIEYHCKIIQQKFIRRALMGIGDKFKLDATNDSLDALDLLEKCERAVFDVQGTFFQQNTSSLAQIAARDLKIMTERKETGDIVGVPTYYQEVDDIIHSFKPGKFYVFAGRPGMGKTAFLVGCAKAQGEEGDVCAIFSLEMTDRELLRRMISADAEIPGNVIENETMEDYQYQGYLASLNKIGEYPVYIDDTPGIHINELCSKARRLKKSHDIGVIYIDYLQLMNATNIQGVFNREQEIAHISRRLKALAKELKIAVVALAQLSRAVETRGGTKRPQLSDLRESGQIEQDCDVIGFFYRPEYYEILEDEEGNSLKGVAELIIAKNRSGSLKTAKLKFIGKFTQFKSLSVDFEAEELPFGYGTIITRPSKMNDDEDIEF